MASIHRPPQRDTIFVLSVGAVLALITILPYLLGAALSSPDLRFSGFLIGQEDGYSYLCDMLQGYQGHWLFHLRYTSEPHDGGLFFLFYILLGKLARLSGLSLILTFHVSRAILIPIGLYAFYRLACCLSPSRQVHRLAVLLFAFGAGLGWLWAVLGLPTTLGDMPVDLWVPDASYFLSSFTYPHLVLGQALLFGFIVFTLRYLDEGNTGDALGAMLTGLGASLIHPYKVPVIGVPLAAYGLWRVWASRWSLARLALRLAIVCAPSAIYVIYTWRVFQTNPAFAEWQAQNLLYSPSIWLYILGLGVPFLLAIVGLWGARMFPACQAQGSTTYHPFLVVWFLVIPPLLYLPHPIQRRFMDGYQAAIVILAAGALCALRERLPVRRWRTIVLAVLTVTIPLSNLLLFAGAISTAATPREPVYRPAWEIDAANWFWRDATVPVVLSSYATGNMLPAHSPVRSFLGHGSQTMNRAHKSHLVDEFFATAQTNSWRESLLREYGIGYVYHGPREKALGGFAPAQATHLNLAYDNGTVQIYGVR